MNIEFLTLLHIKGKMRPVETIPGIGKEGR
jgi:hypothetical protein